MKRSLRILLGTSACVALVAGAGMAQVYKKTTYQNPTSPGSPNTAISTSSGTAGGGGAGVVYSDPTKYESWFVFPDPSLGKLQGFWGDTSFVQGPVSDPFSTSPPGFQDIETRFNGGQYYHARPGGGTDANNIALRVWFRSIVLTDLNDGAIGVTGANGGGMGNFGVVNTPFATSPNVFDTRQGEHAGVRVFDNWDQSVGDLGPNDLQRNYVWQSYQDTIRRPDHGFNTGPVGGGVNNPSYDTFDLMLEYAPQDDGRVRMYIAERKHTSLNRINGGGPDDNGTNIWRHHDFLSISPGQFYNINNDPADPNHSDAFLFDTFIYAGVTNRIASGGGNIVRWGDITVEGFTFGPAGLRAAVPEPGTLLLVGASLLSVGGLSLRRRQRK